MTLDPSQPLDDALPVSLQVEVSKASKRHPAGIANDGYWGIPVQPAARYHASFYAKAAPGFKGSVIVSIQSDDGGTVYAKGEVSGLTQDWKQYEVTLETGKVKPTAKTRYVLTLDRPGKVWFDLVSLFPPTWQDQPNGFRKDLMQMLVDLKPKFLRFPGGNYLEGDTIATRFDWKKTIGPISQRPGHRCPWGYRSSDGMGLLEFLRWCEDMGAEPVLAVYAGYSLGGKHVNPGPDLEPYVQDALDEIEYVTGPVTTKWGAERAQGRSSGTVSRCTMSRSATRIGLTNPAPTTSVSRNFPTPSKRNIPSSNASPPSALNNRKSSAFTAASPICSMSITTVPPGLS